MKRIHKSQRNFSRLTSKYPVLFFDLPVPSWAVCRCGSSQRCRRASGLYSRSPCKSWDAPSEKSDRRRWWMGYLNMLMLSPNLHIMSLDVVMHAITYMRFLFLIVLAFGPTQLSWVSLRRWWVPSFLEAFRPSMGPPGLRPRSSSRRVFRRRNRRMPGLSQAKEGGNYPGILGRMMTWQHCQSLM